MIYNIRLLIIIYYKMISQTIKLNQSMYPIHLISQLPSLRTQGQVINLLISTMDKKVILVSLKQKQKSPSTEACEFNQFHCLINTKQVITATYYEESSKLCYLAGANGSLQAISIHISADSCQCQDIQWVFQPPQSSSSKQSTILLIYARSQSLITWSISNIINIIDIKTASLIKSFQLCPDLLPRRPLQICSATHLCSPFSHKPGACVAFNNGSPPIFFDCQVSKNVKTVDIFQQIYRKSVNIYKTLELQQFEVVTICEETYLNQAQGETYIVCGCRGAKQKQNFITVYNFAYDSDCCIPYFEPVYKFAVEKYIFHITLRKKLVMVSIQKQILVFNIQSRFRQLTIKKADLQVAFCYILKEFKSSICFMFNKGFNFWQPQHKMEPIKLRIRQRAANKKNKS